MAGAATVRRMTLFARVPFPWPRRTPRTRALGLFLGALVLQGFAAGTGETPKSSTTEVQESWPQYTLQAEAWWLLNTPGNRRFDASALLRLPNGDFWTVNDQAAGVYRIAFHPDAPAADLIQVPEILTPAHQAALLQSPRPGLRLDCEGLARDAQGRIYLCEEARRWILRWDPATGAMTRLEIDWTPVRRHFHPIDFNASFEGIAIDGQRLYVANERQAGRLIVVDLERLAVVDDFVVVPADSLEPDAHYTDLCWAEGSLWVLLRDVRRVLRVDPVRRQVQAEFDFGAVETRAAVAYGTFFAPGFMEGLWVDATHLWLLSDNNGVGRRADSKDTRPTLFRCPRPDLEPAAK